MRTGGSAGALLRRGFAAGARRPFPRVSGAGAAPQSAALHAASSASGAAAARSSGARGAVFSGEPAGTAASVPDAPGHGAAARLVHHEGRCFVAMPLMERAPHPAALFQPGAAWDWRAPMPDDSGAAAAAAAVSAIGYGELEGLLASIDLDGELAWEELQAGSVMKKRKKAMNKHKWKKRRKRDRNYDR